MPLSYPEKPPLKHKRLICFLLLGLSSVTANKGSNYQCYLGLFPDVDNCKLGNHTDMLREFLTSQRTPLAWSVAQESCYLD